MDALESQESPHGKTDTWDRDQLIDQLIESHRAHEHGGLAHPPVPFPKTRPSGADGNRQAVREFSQLLFHIRQGPALTSE